MFYPQYNHRPRSPAEEYEFVDIETTEDPEDNTPIEPVLYISSFVTRDPSRIEVVDVELHSDNSDVDVDVDDDEELRDNDQQIIQRIMTDILDLICFQENTEIKREKLVSD